MNTMTQGYTKGPWDTTKHTSAGKNYIRVAQESTGFTVAEVVLDPQGFEKSEREANASLVAAAPELLEELVIADKLISVLLNAFPQEEGQKTRLEVYKKLCALHNGEGVTRSQERLTAIAKAKGCA